MWICLNKLFENKVQIAVDNIDNNIREWEKIQSSDPSKVEKKD